MIIDYGHFGDVISFDTTYKVVHINRPFAIFLGMNHHQETIVFGAALMYYKTADSFVWLFEMFLKAVGGKTPKTIITDQDATMAKALKQKNLLFLFKRIEGIKKAISKLMFQIEEEDDFIREWDLMITKYGVAGNKWLSTLLDLRHKWTLVKHDWSAGMSNTQLSESFNGQLKYYLSRQLILPEFFTHFDRLLSDERYKEHEAEYGFVERQPELKIKCHILRQAGKDAEIPVQFLNEESYVTPPAVFHIRQLNIGEPYNFKSDLTRLLSMVRRVDRRMKRLKALWNDKSDDQVLEVLNSSDATSNDGTLGRTVVLKAAGCEGPLIDV
ncbi:protein FAR-RED IMPAIRED RESPONSE 1-like [Cornus florida]|uniref:protein FAR-RED IMPAIRED RESPONSE 1-like n=1 Tax=Cornus florida TaxID=4283 RepID=UPI0028974933|nr:protein FAR-RED IMPAIRED RESPONSE 1-like [Cornus florida]